MGSYKKNPPLSLIIEEALAHMQLDDQWWIQDSDNGGGGAWS